jgi:uracil-DNA glycosylase family 4
MVATVRCAPPANKPTVSERDTCAPWLRSEIDLLSSSVRVVVALGAYGWAAALAAYRDLGHAIPRPRPKFGHPAEIDLGGVVLLGCYHPSQHNTFTGRLTPEMLDDVFLRARTLAHSVR